MPGVKVEKKDCAVVYNSLAAFPKNGKKDPIQVRALQAASVHFDKTTPEGRYILARLETKALHAVKRSYKPKKTEWQKTRDKADTVFQKYIRVRDGDYEVGIFRCCTCSKLKTVSHLQAGHCIERRSKGSMGTRWEETNCNGQCDFCNDPSRGGGRRSEHEAFIVDKHGQKELDRLILLQKINRKKPTIEYMNEVIEKYQKKTKIIEGE